MRALTTHEPLFNDDDVESVMERKEYVDAQCPGCGNPRGEVWLEDPAEFHKESKLWYVEPIACVACKASDAGRRKYNRNDNVDSDGVHFPMIKIEEDES